jgi:hypothetical protein
MGKAKEYRKIRKETRKNADRIAKEFNDSFDIRDYIISKPFIIPKFIWNILINWLIKK